VNEDKSRRYHRLKRRASLLSLAWSTALLGGLLVTGWTAALRDASARIGPAMPAAAYVLLLLLLNEIVALPLSFYTGLALERRYELSNESVGAWLLDRLKAFAIVLIVGAASASFVYRLIRVWPDGWWLPAGIAFTVLMIGVTNVAPVLLLPLFYSVQPLRREALRSRLLVLAERAGARVFGVYELGLGVKTKKANAALAGLGSTRRILVSDTMLAEYSDDEIEVVLAHELGHHVHGDLWKAMAFESALLVGGCYLAARTLTALVAPAGLHDAADVAGLPLLLLAAGALSVAMVPVANAVSRRLERRADRFALGLTRNPAAFVSAMRRLGVQNLAEERPSKTVQWLFYTHPPIHERIAAAQAFTLPAR
jgi:Zn-dependent protease with chaperone function